MQAKEETNLVIIAVIAFVLSVFLSLWLENQYIMVINIVTIPIGMYGWYIISRDAKREVEREAELEASTKINMVAAIKLKDGEGHVAEIDRMGYVRRPESEVVFNLDPVEDKATKRILPAQSKKKPNLKNKPNISKHLNQKKSNKPGNTKPPKK